MKEKAYKGPERRQFLRLDYVTPLAYKVCKKKTLSILLQGYTSNISQSGLLCNIKEPVNKNDILWVSFDRTTLNVCEDLEKRSLIYQNGIIGKVVRAQHKKDGSYNVGIQFITREEKNLTNIYPKIYFLQSEQKDEEA
jgi:c-di-GMP-binding flagellar brake protein YcgR